MYALVAPLIVVVRALVPYLLISHDAVKRCQSLLEQPPLYYDQNIVITIKYRPLNTD